MNRSDLLSTEKRTIQEFGDIKVEKNAIYFSDKSFQTSNITRTWISKFAKEPFHIAPVIIIIIALVFISSKNWMLILIGLIGVAVGAYSIYKFITGRTDKFGLHIELSSGYLYIFSSYDLSFLREFQSVITDDFIGRASSFVVNLDEKTIVNNSGIISYGDNTSNQNISAGGIKNE